MNMKNNSIVGAILNTPPLVSVVIPMYNHEQYIVECLESVASQNYPRIEILVLDDGSSDCSYRLAEEWLHSNAARLERCVVDRQTNQGICPTINTLITRSHGEYLMPLASDDMLCDGALSKLVHFHQKHCEPTDLLFTNVELIDMEGKLITDNAMRYRGKNEAAVASNRQLLELDVILRWGTPYQHQFFPRSFYDQIGGYDESLKFEDVYFAIASLSSRKARYAPITSKKYRIRPGLSITPGLDAQSISALPSRKQGVRGPNPAGKLLIDLANFRDTRRHMISRRLTEKFIGLAYRALYFWRSRVRTD